MSSEQMNELTFVARLGTITALRAERRLAAGEPVLIATGDIEERQVDKNGRVRRCDIRLSTATRRKLASGEMKRPEVPEGRDPRSNILVEDARRKAIARGLPFYFTCNMAEVVLYSVASRAGEPDREEASFNLAPIQNSRDVEAYMPQITERWISFLDDLERRLSTVVNARPSVTNADVLALRDVINIIADEAIDRVVERVKSDITLAEKVRIDAANSFNFATALRPEFSAQFRGELAQILRFGIFVIAQKLILYRVLEDTGPRCNPPFKLDKLIVPKESTDPTAIRSALDSAITHAIRRSRDYETAFLPKPLEDLVFLEPTSMDEAVACRVGEVWYELLETVRRVSWESISQNLIGFLWEVIVDPQFRHQLGQFYTREDVVDLLVTYGVREASDVVMDPSAGGGSFLRTMYRRKRDLGDTHEGALSSVWGFEITAFAAELSTITLATSDTHEPAAYPRVLLKDFFDARPGATTDMIIPGMSDKLQIPKKFDAVIGNPPYISYRRQTNQPKILGALAKRSRDIKLPKFSGKSDAYVWFIVHATQFLKEGGRLSFVVSSAILFSDYGVPLIRFLGRHYCIDAIIDSAVERWFPDADTNTVLLLLRRSNDELERRENVMRFVRLRRPLAQILPPPADENRRQEVEDFVDLILNADEGDVDPRMVVRLIPQGDDAGLQFVDGDDEAVRDLSGEDEV